MKSFIATCLLVFSYQALFTAEDDKELAVWGQNGHRIVAQICYHNLNENAKKEIDKTLRGKYLTQVATWPDFIRSEKNWNFTKPWHFITIDPNKTVQQVIERAAKDPDVNNVYEAIELMTSILKGNKTAIKTLQDLVNSNNASLLNNSIKATALAFLVHFIGDVHQPMHVGKNKDFGGNKISVLFFTEKTDLHSVWDSGIIEQEGLSFTDFSDFIEKRSTPNKKSTWQKAKMIDWVIESVKTREKIYNTLYDNTERPNGLPEMSYDYQHDFIETVENRLGAAGYRAAKVLNTIFNP
ncbi:MAG: hypothetical protein ACI848_000976 [Roseivirga sp.]|jgi:hypothetical protein